MLKVQYILQYVTAVQYVLQCVKAMQYVLQYVLVLDRTFLLAYVYTYLDVRPVNLFFYFFLFYIIVISVV